MSHKRPDRCAYAGYTQAAVLATLALCSTLGTQARADKADLASALRSARTWGYQLQDIDASSLARSAHDLLVIDAGSGDGTWGLTRKQVRSLKMKPDGTRRIVLAYMNIGEAEDYRYYWKKAWEKSPPGWMGSENCRWKGDHRVRHWMREWQDITFGTPKSYLGRLMDNGYDGVYLDRVDIFYHWRKTRWQAAAEMVDFVARLSRWAKLRRPGFLIVPQNAEELLSTPRYMAAIDAIGKEDMLFGDRGNDVENTPERIARAERNFAPARTAGPPVFTIEYARDPAHKERIRARHEALGFTLYFGPRSLAYLGQDGPPHPEDGDTESVIPEAGQDACE